MPTSVGMTIVSDRPVDLSDTWYYCVQAVKAWLAATPAGSPGQARAAMTGWVSLSDTW